MSDTFEFLDAEHAARISNTETALPTVNMCPPWKIPVHRKTGMRLYGVTTPA